MGEPETPTRCRFQSVCVFFGTRSFPSPSDRTFPSSAALCLRFRLFVPLSLVSRTSSRSRGLKKKNKRQKKPNLINATVDIFLNLLFIHLTSFEFLIYYNLAIYMNKAVGSVECYLLPSCVFVKWGNI